MSQRTQKNVVMHTCGVYVVRRGAGDILTGVRVVLEYTEAIVGLDSDVVSA